MGLGMESGRGERERASAGGGVEAGMEWVKVQGREGGVVQRGS